MNDEPSYNSGYTGTKGMTQHDVVNANATGFGAAADDHMERGIDLNEQLILNKPATFFFRMNGDAMQAAGIQKGDVLIVDRSIAVSNGKIIVAAVDGELMVRWLRRINGRTYLCTDDQRHGNIAITEFMQYQPWGVVTCVIHLLDPTLKAFAAPPAKTRKRS